MTMLHACVMVYTGGVDMARVNVTMPDKVWVRASVVASELGLSMSAFCVLAVSEYIKQRDAVSGLDALREILQARKSEGGINFDV